MDGGGQPAQRIGFCRTPLPIQLPVQLLTHPSTAPGPQQVHDDDIELPLLALVVHLGHAVHLADAAAGRGDDECSGWGVQQRRRTVGISRRAGESSGGAFGVQGKQWLHMCSCSGTQGAAGSMRGRPNYQDRSLVHRPLIGRAIGSAALAGVVLKLEGNLRNGRQAAG